MKNVVVSGGFDPIHIGHLRLLEKSKKLGDRLIVILNTDRFLKDKKGFRFMAFNERKEILLGFKCVDEVIRSIDQDNTVRKTIEKLCKQKKIDIFANGGDRKNVRDIPEYKICKKNNIKMVFDVGGGKIQSSSDLVNQFNNYKEVRPWGSFENLIDDKNLKVKRILIQPKQKISMQYHNNRYENWIIAKGKGQVTINGKEFSASKRDAFLINKRDVHRVENIGRSNLEIIEVQTGSSLTEKDITRLDDIYGRTKKV